MQTRNARGLVAPSIATGLGAFTHTLGTFVPVIEASGFAIATAATAIGTVVGGHSGQLNYLWSTSSISSQTKIHIQSI